MTYSSKQVTKLVGTTYRQLDYWIRKGYLTPETPLPGSGYPRVFTDADVQRAKDIKAGLLEVRRILIGLGMEMPQWLRGSFRDVA